MNPQNIPSRLSRLLKSEVSLAVLLLILVLTTFVAIRRELQINGPAKLLSNLSADIPDIIPMAAFAKIHFAR